VITNEGRRPIGPHCEIRSVKIRQHENGASILLPTHKESWHANGRSRSKWRSLIGYGSTVLATASLGISSIAETPAAAQPFRHFGTTPFVPRQPRLVSYGVFGYRHFDRVVFVFSGGFPSGTAGYVKRVMYDGSGKTASVMGRAFLHVTLMGLNDIPPNVPREPTLTPGLAVLNQMVPVGVFEGYFSFGLGLSYRTRYQFSTRHHPDRLLLDLDRLR
jgi:hypothetical protein